MDPIDEMNEHDRILWKAITKSPPNLLYLARNALLKGANASGTIPVAGSMTSPMSVLGAALLFGHADVIQLLLEKSATTSGDIETMEMFSHFYTRNHTINDVKLLHCLFKGGVFNRVPRYTVRKLMKRIACDGKLGSADAMCVCIEHLLSRGQNLSELLAYQFGWHGTLLHMAAMSHHRDSRAPLVQLLIDYGASVLAKDEGGRTPIDLARHVFTPINDLARDLYGHDPRVDTILETERIRIAKWESFMMANHPRLGRGSRVNRVDPEVMRLIHGMDPDSRDKPNYPKS
jgi:hypothetical protein